MINIAMALSAFSVAAASEEPTAAQPASRVTPVVPVYRRGPAVAESRPTENQ